VTQQSGNQFDDDLTVGMDDSESFSTGAIDLFEFTGDEESPIARLKTIILSIDWEINDDILQQLDDELLDLGEIWADDKIKQVYIQGLNKIGKYINKERARAHPSSIKLLLTFYHNLEKIVSSDDLMTEEEKKQLLLADVKKFDQLKTVISQSPSASPAEPVTQEPVTSDEVREDLEGATQLKVLKALVLGIDWEINDHDLQSLSDEVQRLEITFSQSKVKLILLQGIGALGSYINKMRSESNKNAFTLLHSFYGTLEKITDSELSAADEKQLLLSEVSKFNAFKAEIAQEKAAPAPAQVVSDGGSLFDQGEPSPVAEHDEAESEDSADIDSCLDSVFGDTTAEIPASVESEDDALEGVNVETEADDDSDEEALPYQGGSVAPALSDASEESSFSVEKLADDLAQSSETEEDTEAETFATSPEEDADAGTDDIYGEELFSAGDEDVAPAFADVSDESSFSVENLAGDLLDSPDFAEDEDIELKTAAFVPGVDVETEADDESDEESLPVEKGKLAPALAGAADEQGFDEERMASEDEESPSDDLEDRLGAFFDDEVEASAEEWGTGKEPIAAETKEDDTDAIAALSDVSEEDEKAVTDEELGLSVAPENGEETVFLEEADEEKSIEDETAARLSFLDEDKLSDEGESSVETLALGEEGVDESIADDINEFLLDEESVEEATEEALSFLDEEEVDTPAMDASEGHIEPVADESEITVIAVVEEDSEELASTDTIAFTVPGEVNPDAEIEETEENEFTSDDVIEFNVPGEEFIPETVLFSADEAGSEEVIFEAVDDDVAVDLLPGEEYVDQASEESESEEQQFDDHSPQLPGATVEVEEVVEDSGGGEENVEKYRVLGANIETLHTNVTEDGIQEIYSEVNRLRSSGTSSHTDKIFLQLLSTVCQHIEGRAGDSGAESISLLDDIFAGLELSSANTDQVQQQVLACISQVLLLQQKSM
jgi:pilus assembly protein FimV